MSAFLLSNNHINTICNFVANNKPYGKTYTTEDLQCLGNAFMLENDKSVSYLYGQHEGKGKAHWTSYMDNPVYKYNYKDTKNITWIGFCKLLDCLKYQCCEHPDWEKTYAYEQIQYFHSWAYNQIPGYSAAKWVLD